MLDNDSRFSRDDSGSRESVHWPVSSDHYDTSSSGTSSSRSASSTEPGLRYAMSVPLVLARDGNAGTHSPPQVPHDMAVRVVMDGRSELPAV